jgi:hypothetical protein
MAYDDALVHTAVPLLTEEDGPWVNGEPDVEENPGAPFACCLFLPQDGDTPTPRGARRVKTPLLLVADVDDDGSPVELAPEDELEVTVTPDLIPALGAETTRWQVEAGPQPFGPPGDDLVGSQVTLKRVRD